MVPTLLSDRRQVLKLLHDVYYDDCCVEAELRGSENGFHAAWTCQWTWPSLPKSCVCVYWLKCHWWSFLAGSPAPFGSAERWISFRSVPRLHYITLHRIASMLWSGELDFGQQQQPHEVRGRASGVVGYKRFEALLKSRSPWISKLPRTLRLGTCVSEIILNLASL